mmetsp:Transcript_21525/g.64404  ORF Transcript_21525/g.64404 Transcript_21525/m.64404 type:complete len:351 (+) Transcript_21525:233-1285(+)
MAAVTTSDVARTLPGGLVLRGIRHQNGLATDEDGGGRWLLLHGWLDNAASFTALAPRLAEHESFSDVVALDMAGHGLSDRRGGPYHAVDFAADARNAADALWGPQARFNVLGHSLGGGVGLVVAGTWPDRVARVCSIESVGPLAAAAGDAPSVLRKACRRFPSGNSAVFADVAKAAERRATKNVVPDARFSEAEALVLAERGTKSVAGGVTWRTDPWLLAPSRLRLDPEQGLAFARNTEAPALLVVAKDGAFSGGRGRWPRPFSLATVVIARLVSMALGHAGRFFALPAALRRATEAASQLADMGARGRALRRRTVIELESGGHHVHMTEPDAVAAAVAAWARKTRAAGP